ncbi:hypothetical protein ACKLNR_005678 [Fusarium oxysporum f. sp. zingiberi]
MPIVTSHDQPQSISLSSLAHRGLELPAFGLVHLPEEESNQTLDPSLTRYRPMKILLYVPNLIISSRITILYSYNNQQFCFRSCFRRRRSQKVMSTGVHSRCTLMFCLSESLKRALVNL